MVYCHTHTWCCESMLDAIGFIAVCRDKIKGEENDERRYDEYRGACIVREFAGLGSDGAHRRCSAARRASYVLDVSVCDRGAPADRRDPLVMAQVALTGNCIACFSLLFSLSTHATRS